MLYINDIVHEIHSNIRLFADDTTIYIIVDFPDSAAQIFNIDLDRIAHWAAKRLVGFHAKKTETSLISRRLCRLNHRTLFFNHVPIPEGKSHKLLGIYFSDKRDWQVHLNYIQEKSLVSFTPAKIDEIYNRQEISTNYLLFIYRATFRIYRRCMGQPYSTTN